MTTVTSANNRIVIAYDMNLENFQMATAIRGVLEFYGLQVTLVWLNEKQDAILGTGQKLKNVEKLINEQLQIQ